MRSHWAPACGCRGVVPSNPSPFGHVGRRRRPKTVRLQSAWRINPETRLWAPYVVFEDGSLGAMIPRENVQTASAKGKGKAAAAGKSVAATRSCGDGATAGIVVAAAAGSEAAAAPLSVAAAAAGIEQRPAVTVMATQPVVVVKQRPTVALKAPQATEEMVHRPAVAVKAPPPPSRDRAASPQARFHQGLSLIHQNKRRRCQQVRPTFGSSYLRGADLSPVFADRVYKLDYFKDWPK